MCGGSGLYIDAICNGVDEMPDHDEQVRKEMIKFYEENGIEALRYELKKIDPEYYKIVDLRNPQRILRALEIYHSTGIPFTEFRKNSTVLRNFDIIKIGINLDREILYNRINLRVDEMIKLGLVDEAKLLYDYKHLVALKTIGYRELFDYFENKTNLAEAIDLIKRNTRHYARRQLTWFRKYKDALWFAPDKKIEVTNYIKSEILNVK
jgi:tRNA dimethylallyltransferase